MEAVNLAAAKAAKKTQDPQDHKTERREWSEVASNALLDVTSKEPLEEQPAGPEIIVVPQTIQESPEDEENVLEISGELPECMELADQIVVRRRVPVEDPEDEMGSFGSNPVLTTLS